MTPIDAVDALDATCKTWHNLVQIDTTWGNLIQIDATQLPQLCTNVVLVIYKFLCTSLKFKEWFGPGKFEAFTRLCLCCRYQYITPLLEFFSFYYSQHCKQEALYILNLKTTLLLRCFHRTTLKFRINCAKYTILQHFDLFPYTI